MEKVKKEDIRVKKSKECLYVALAMLLQHKTFDKITVLDICEKAHVNRMTFYNHYQDKYDLLNEFIKLSISEIETQYYKQTKGIDVKSNPYECLSALAKILVELIYNYEKIIRNLTTDQESSLSSFMLKRTLDETILKVIKESKVEAATDYPIEFIITFFAGGASNLFNLWLQNKNSLTKDEFLKYLNRAIKAVIDSEVLLKL